MSDSSSDSTRYRWRWVVGAIVTGVVVWVLFFDSHSVLKRYYWHQELDALKQENARLRADIDRLKKKLDAPLPDSVVERIAREQYGMKRPGETIHHIESQ